jgi:hypothetical protein
MKRQRFERRLRRRHRFLGAASEGAAEAPADIDMGAGAGKVVALARGAKA